MKVVTRCCNCGVVVRLSHCFRVKLFGQRNMASMLEKPLWEAVEEKVFICKPCGALAGYRVKGDK